MTSQIPRATGTHSGKGVWLIAVAATRELDALLRAARMDGQAPSKWSCFGINERFDGVWTGVGKANAAGAVARVLDPSRHLGVLSIGIGGALPGSGVKVGDVICADRSVFVDEGIETPAGWLSTQQMGFGAFEGSDNKDASDTHRHDPEVVRWLSGLAHGVGATHIGPVACVSTCAGTDRRAQWVRSTSGALGEAMEGAGVCLSAMNTDRALLTGELRVVSNTTGDRETQQWDLDGALDRLGEVFGRVIQEPM
ncbi:MAG: futalosine hydrolase [Phycisphaerales bacterium]